MASRRMISSKIIDSARFIKMPVSCQNLYFHLISRADDDGVIEAFNIMRLVGASEDDLRVLVAKGFVVVLNEDLVTYVTDWLEHNNVRQDRKVDSIYKDLLIQMIDGIELVEAKPRSDRPNRQIVRHGTVPCQTMDSLGEVRLGEVRLGQDIPPTPKGDTENNFSLNGISITKEVISKSGETLAHFSTEVIAHWNSKRPTAQCFELDTALQRHISEIRKENSLETITATIDKLAEAISNPKYFYSRDLSIFDFTQKSEFTSWKHKNLSSLEKFQDKKTEKPSFAEKEAQTQFYGNKGNLMSKLVIVGSKNEQ